MHTNNAKYAEWITDSIDIELFKTHRIKEFQINYNSETLLGDKIDIYRKEIQTPEDILQANNIQQGENNTASRTFYFEGRKNGKAAFESIFTFVPTE